MTITSGAPDWSPSFPVKAKRLIDDDVTLVGGLATLGPYDVTGYTGIIVEHLAVTADQSFGLIQFSFDDPQLSLFTPPTYVVNWRGDKAIKLNVPVLGPRVTLQYQGTANGHQSHCSAVAHSGGGQSSYGRNATWLVNKFNAALAAGVAEITEAALIREGPATLCLQTGQANMRAYVQATDHLGGTFPIADTGAASGTTGITVPLWIPPYSIDVRVDNNGGVASSYTATLTLGRD